MSDKLDNLDLGFDIPEDALESMPDPELVRRWPQSLTDMLSVVEAEMVRLGVEPSTAQRIAFLTIRTLAQYHGGQVFYLAKGEQLTKALRDRQIWEAFDGTNHAELARQYHLNVVQIYRILAEQRKLERARMQPDLF